MDASTPFKIVMTPHKKGKLTTIQVEKIPITDAVNDVYLEGKNRHQGMVICKESPAPKNESPPEMHLDFKCFLMHTQLQQRTVENRKLKFWFFANANQFDKMTSTYEFFKELVKPGHFPKDYAGFITKVIKQLQESKYVQVKRVDLDFQPLEKHEQETLVPEHVVTRPIEEVVREQLQVTLEQAYPNVLSTDDLVRILDVDRNIIVQQLHELQKSGVLQDIKMEGKFVGQTGFRRNVKHVNEEVKELESQEFKKVNTKGGPTIAIITNLLCEKLAVDAMMRDKTTFVKYKTEGESTVYTIGYIGDHKVISTKLPMVGTERAAKISSGNNTTRLLGTFQDVQHVFIVGVAGGVPNICNFEKHSRLGDVVVSYSIDSADTFYVYCEKVIEPIESDQPIRFTLKKWSARDKLLQRVIENALDNYEKNPKFCSWLENAKEAAEILKTQDSDFSRPPSEKDRVLVDVGSGQILEMSHPEIPSNLEHLYQPKVPAVRLGCIGSGKPIVSDPELKDKFAQTHGLLAYDAEYDQVLDSILGSRYESFVLIRGVADYLDGSKGKDWQPYAALSAAAFMKCIIQEIRSPKR